MVALQGLDEAQWRINRAYNWTGGGCMGASRGYVGLCRLCGGYGMHYGADRAR